MCVDREEYRLRDKANRDRERERARKDIQIEILRERNGHEFYKPQIENKEF